MKIQSIFLSKNLSMMTLKTLFFNSEITEEEILTAVRALKEDISAGPGSRFIYILCTNNLTDCIRAANSQKTGLVR